MWAGAGLGLHFRRLRYRNTAAAELRACWQCAPSPGKAEEFLVLDLETTGLDAACGEVVSIAWVAISRGRVRLNCGAHLLVRGQQSVGASAEFHLLRDCERELGLDIDQIMSRLLEAARGRVLVFHHAGLDLAFLDKLSRRCCGAPLLLPHLDTLVIERDKLQQRDHAIAPGALRLGACRQRYGLPDYPAHNAYNDALATAELLLAQRC